MDGQVYVPWLLLEAEFRSGLRVHSSEGVALNLKKEPSALNDKKSRSLLLVCDALG